MYYKYLYISMICIFALFVLVAGLLAREMGLPMTLVCAVNVNDIVARTVSEGDFSKSATVQPTLAPAMDIQVASFKLRNTVNRQQYDCQ